MQFTLWLFGCEVFAVRIGQPDQAEPEKGAGDCTTYPVGFTASPGDQRWEKGADTL